MICNCCRRRVEFVRTSFWHGDVNICRECFAAWCDPDNDQVGGTDHLAIGNHIRLRHGLPPLAAAAILLLAYTSPSHASRHCLDQAEAARTWPARALTRDGDGCWTYDRNPLPAKAPAPPPEVPVSKPEAAAEPEHDAELNEWWLESELVRSELRQLELDQAAHPRPASPEGPNFSVRQLALFVALVLATVSVLRVATWRVEGPAPSRWPPAREAD
jgi:hypothetical protein